MRLDFVTWMFRRLTGNLLSGPLFSPIVYLFFPFLRPQCFSLNVCSNQTSTKLRAIVVKAYLETNFFLSFYWLHHLWLQIWLHYLLLHIWLHLLNCLNNLWLHICLHYLWLHIWFDNVWLLIWLHHLWVHIWLHV